MSDELLELALRIEAASGPDRTLDALAAVACGFATAVHPTKPERCAWHDGMGLFTASPDYTASLDAAMTLVPEGYALDMFRDDEGCSAMVGSPASGKAATLPLALTAAALRARASHLRMEVE